MTSRKGSTLWCGKFVIGEPEMIRQCVRVVLDQRCNWTVPPEYGAEHVSDTVVKIVLGYTHSLRAMERSNL